MLKNPLLTTKFSELEVNVRFGIRLQSYTVYTVIYCQILSCIVTRAMGFNTG